MATRDNPDLIVVGAGAAGLSAARTALSLGLSVRVLEAKDRLGGRAVTDTTSLGVPWDRGAHWLHHARTNAYSAFARDGGFDIETAPSTPYLWDGTGWASDAVDRARTRYFERAFAAAKAAGAAGRDVAAGNVVPDDARFRVMFDSWYAAVSGAEPDRTSALDDSRYLNDPENWRVRAGYGTLVARFGAGLPVSLGTPAGRVCWDGPGVVVETPNGELRGEAAIVTVSTSAIAGGALRFDPALPAPIAVALEAVPLGEAEKAAVLFDRDIFDLPANSSLHFTHDTLEAIRFQIRPFGENVAIGHFSGRFAAEIERAGTDAMTGFALDRLADAFGADIRRAVKAMAATHWTSDPEIRGGYSSALPGRADQRDVLRQPVGGRLYFAGEACSITAYGTVHGAHDSGAETARRVAARLGKSSVALGEADAATESQN